MEELLKRIDLAISKYRDREIFSKLNPGSISEDRVVLASLLASLGEHVADARRDYEQADHDAEVIKLNAFNKAIYNGQSATQAKETAKYEALEAFSVVVRTRHIFERLRILHDDCSEILNAMSSRLRVLEREQVQSNYS